jgi:hypothetical protein
MLVTIRSLCSMVRSWATWDPRASKRFEDNIINRGECISTMESKEWKDKVALRATLKENVLYLIFHSLKFHHEFPWSCQTRKFRNSLE